MKIMKRFFSMLLVFCLAATVIPQTFTVAAGSSKLTFSSKTSGVGNNIVVKSIKYDNDVPIEIFDYEPNSTLSEFEVDFLTDVSWRNNAKVSSVKDNKGRSYEGFLSDRDDDECDIVIPNIKEGRTYTIVINGIKKYGTLSYRRLTLKVKLPSQSTSAKKVTVASVSIDEEEDYGGPEIDVKFKGKVAWKRNAKVSSIKDNKGRSYKGFLIDKDDDECEIFINNVKYDRTYTIKISGIKARGASSYGTVTITAKIPPRSGSITVKKIEYDVDHEYYGTEYTVSFEFNKKILHKNSSYVLITDDNGNAYSSPSSFVEWDDDECEVHLSRELTIGNTYHYEIVDISARGSNQYHTLKGTFPAYYD